ncbi:HIT family protein [archaeon]|nr:HIT family protein [archaeon]|tara:strand:- start:885 stop:1298 length:414 start_codon:yes stop_codon:yes gene_type:complete
MSDCIFCKIVKEEVPCSKVYEDDLVLAFLDINPVNKGHVLVISKGHYETILDIPDDVLKELILVVKKVSKAVKEGMNVRGFNVTMNNYKEAGQLVPHAHFHIIPRNGDDGLKAWPSGVYSDGEIDGVLNKIRDKLVV